MSVFGQNTAFQEVRIGAVAQHFKVVISLYKRQACTLKAVDELIGYAAGVGRKGGDGASLKAITDTEFRVVRRAEGLDAYAAHAEHFIYVYWDKPVFKLRFHCGEHLAELSGCKYTYIMVLCKHGKSRYVIGVLMCNEHSA